MVYGASPSGTSVVRCRCQRRCRQWAFSTTRWRGYGRLLHQRLTSGCRRRRHLTRDQQNGRGDGSENEFHEFLPNFSARDFFESGAPAYMTLDMPVHIEG